MNLNSRENPFISFIVPVYNTSSDYMKQCFDSILKLDACTFELLIVNDGSTNKDTLKVLDKYNENSNVRVINKINGGVSSSRNVGIDNATGDYIAFVDSDDYIETDNFTDIVKMVRANSDIVFFVFTHNDIDDNGNIITVNSNSGDFFVCNNIFDLCEMGINHKATFTRESVWAKLYKRSSILGIYFDDDVKFGEDNLFVLNVWNKNRTIMAFCKTFYNYRVNCKSATNKYNPNILEERLVNLYRLENLYLERNYISQLDVFYNEAIFRTYVFLILRLWVFHKNCPLGFKSKRMMAIEILHKEPFDRMLKNVNVKKLNLKAKISYYLLKRNLVFLGYKVYLMHKPKFIMNK